MEPEIEKTRVIRKKLKPSVIMFRVVTIAAFFLVFIASSAVYGYHTLVYSGGGDLYADTDNATALNDHYNFLLVGEDQSGSRTDTMLIGSYDTEENKLGIISIPRDTYIVMPEDRRQILEDEGYYVPSDGVMKMTEIVHYSHEYGMDFLQAQLEEVMGVDLDFYVKVDTEAFRYVIDSMGGVEFDVPQRMYYMDPDQGLEIDLYEGLQVLNGEQAEGLVRYRKADINNPISESYPRGDLDRIEVQQDFLTACLDQFLSVGNITKLMQVLMNSAINYIDTDFNISTVYKFTSLITSFDMENLRMETLPSEATYINGKSYVKINEEEKDTMVNEIFY